jgi:hypothetical protein
MSAFQRLLPHLPDLKSFNVWSVVTQLTILESRWSSVSLPFLDHTERCILSKAAATRGHAEDRRTTTSKMIGPMNMPPTTTVASGRCT